MALPIQWKYPALPWFSGNNGREGKEGRGGRRGNYP